MDYEGTRDTASEVPMGEVALGRAASDITASAAASASAGGIVLTVDANNTVILPEGATLDDITVRGRDLVIQTDDGRIFIVPDGAVFVPQIVAQGVTVPPLNLAALLIGQEPEPAAGPVRSSGGNFAVPVDPLQDAYDLGDLLPYTELAFPEPQVREIFPSPDGEPEIIIFTPDNPAGAANATDSVDEAGLPEREADESESVEPEGTDATSNSETTAGTIRVSSPDGIGSLTVEGVALDLDGVTVITTDRGVLTITGNGTNTFAYSYTLTDNTEGEGTTDPFTVVVTDTDGDTATGTLTIRIIDDEPIARDDTDTVAAGTYGPEAGNVLSGSGTTSGTAGADTPGADDAALTGVRVGTTGDFVAPGTTLDGTYGTLVLNPNGSYTYVRDPGTRGGVSDVFSYQITDGDGDTSTATLTIDIADALPLTGENAAVLLDDDALAGGNPGGTDDDADAANLTGTLAASGGDGPLTWALSTTGAPDGFSYVANGTGIDIVQGETLVVQVTLNSATGAYTVTQVAPIQHVAGSNENNQGFTLGYSVTDQDGDTDNGNLTINVDDDTPTAVVVFEGEVAALIVDETTLIGTTAENFAGMFASTFGADGAGSIAYGLDVTAGPSGLVDTLTGEDVVLSMNGGVAEGRTQTTGLLVFTASVAADGTVTLTQGRAVVHNPDNGPDDVVSLTSTLVTLTQTVTDSDGDTAVAVANIGAFLNFVDDAPTAGNDTDTIASGSYGPATGNVLTDASAGDTGDSDTGADAVGNDGGEVTAVTGFGGDGTIGGTTTGEHGVLTLNDDGSYSYTRDPGTPGGVTDTFIYTVTDGDGDTATATLIITIEDAQPVTADNAAVLLDDDALAGGIPGGTGDDADAVNVTGTLAASGGDGPLTWSLATSGAPAGFTYTANGTGLDVFQGATLVMQVTLDSATGAYTVSQIAAIDHPAGGDENNTSFTFDYDVTDQDGDNAGGTLAVNVDDDTPTVTANALVRLDDDTLGGNPDGNGDDTNSANAIGTLGHSFGADGGSIAFTTAGAPDGFSYVANGTGIDVFQGATQVLAITLNPATGAYTVVQTAPIDHAAGLDENNQAFTLNYAVTDGDGDVVPGTLQVSVDDDTAIALAATTSGTVDEDGLPGGNTAAAPGDVAGAALSASGSVTGLFSAGADVPLTYSLSSITSSLPALASGGVALSYAVAGNVLTATAGAVTVFTLTLDATTGQWDFVLSATLDHAAGLNENDINIDFGGLIIATDNDGDSVTAIGNLIVTVDDDTQLLANDTDTVASGTYGPATGNILTDAAAGDAGDADTGADSLGADGGTLTTITGAGGAGTIGGTTNGQYGVLTLQPDGSYSYARNPGTPGGVTDTFTYTVIDGDDDIATATLVITIEDARPLAPADIDVQTDDDTFGGNPGGTGDDPDAVNLTGFLGGSGGDGPLSWTLGSVVFAAPFNFAVNFISPISYQITQNSVVVLTVTIDGATGAYTIVQNAPIQHVAGLDENNTLLRINYVARDQDGDFVNGFLNVNLDDDTAVLANDTDEILSGSSAPATGNVLTDAAAGDAGDGDTGADSLGADGGTITAIVNSNGVAGIVGGTTAGLYGTLTLNLDGSYSYTRTAGTPGNAEDVFTYTVTDGDGDVATATLTISIEDARPFTTPNATVLLDDDALAGGNAGGTGDDADAAFTSGSLSGAGGDGALTWALLTTGAPSGFSYVANGTGLNILQGATLVMQVTLNTASGAYTVTQVAAIDHTASGAENNQGFTLNYTVTDADGDSAPGTLAIDVDDDTPLAANDTDSIASGTYGPATGNVLTDAAAGDAGDGDTGADSLGADGGSLTAITGFGGAGTIGGTTTGQYGVLTLQPGGNYSYTRNPGTPGGVTDTFTYTVTDGDGDIATATLTIAIVNAEPLAPANATVLLDDDALAGGNPGGTGDDADAAFTSGTLAATGGDGPLTWALLTTGAPSGFSYVANGTGLNILQGATLVMQVTLNPASGAYTVSQVAPIDHTALGDENNQGFTLNYTVTDQDSDVASGTLAIDVDDDTAVLANDTDSLLAGATGPATGNVLTDASAGDAGDSDTGADSVGADGGTVTAITGFGGAGTIGGSTTGQHGTLTLGADGNYSYTRSGTGPINATDVFTYTVTDGDGDTAIATLTITLQDAAPSTTPNATVLLDDDALAGGNPGGTGDDADAAFTTGSLSGSGGNGALTWALLTTGAPAGFSYVANGTGINVLQGATLVMQVTLNPATGGYVVTQVAPIVHTTGSDENNQAFTLNYTVADADGDSAGGTLSINVDDDTPTAAASATQPVLVVDETLLGSDATASFAGVFTTAFGADGAALAGSTVYALGINAGATGLVDVATGTTVVLTVESGQVVGRAGAGGEVVFTVSVAANGDVTLDQSRAVRHNDPLDPDEPGASAAGVSADNLITLTATVTDRDGDQASATANIGSNLQFEDDGPSLTMQSPTTAASLTATGTLALAVGADLHADGTNLDSFVNAVLSGGTVGTGLTQQNITVTSVGQLPSTTNTPSIVTYTFSFTYDSDPGAPTVNVANGGTLTLNTATGQYSVVLDDPVGYTQTVQTSQALSITPYQAESPADEQGAQAEFAVSQLAPGFFVQFYGDHNGLSYANGSNSPFLGSPGYVSVSGSANGVNSDTIQQNDVLNLDFFTADPGGDSTPEQARAFADAIFIQIDNFGNDEDGFIVLKLVDPANPNTIIYRTFHADHSDFYTQATGSPPGYTFTFDSNDAALVIEANDYRLAGDPVEYVIAGLQYVVSSEGTDGTAFDLNGAVGAAGGLIDLTANAFGPGDVTDDNDVTKITNIGLRLTTSTPQPVTFDFNVTANDADGDSVTTPLSVTFPASVMPVVLDLDGDGAEFVSLAAGVVFDYGGDGTAESTAWAGRDDGLLAIDSNGDGAVNDGSEIVFGGNGLTDLQGIAANYDSNGDGILSAADASYGEFGVWQDANSDGVSQAGEFCLLGEMGIASINLTSDGQAYSAAGGDVQVSGETTFTRADGSTGTVADAAFAIAERLSNRSGELVAASVAAVGLIAAIVAETTDPVAGADLTSAPQDVEVGTQAASLELTNEPSGGSDSSFAAARLAVAAKAPIAAERLSASDDAAAAHGGLDQAAGRIAEHGNDGAKSALFGEADHAMDALLAPGAFAATGGPAQVGNPALVAALEDSAGAEAVDAIVDHFAGATTEAPEQMAQGEAFGFESLLQLGVSGGSSDLGAAAFGAMPMMDHDEQAAAMA